MKIRCIQCHKPIEVTEGSSLANVECQACGSHYSFVGDDTPTASTLGDLIQTKTMTPVEAAEICSKITSSLGHIHEAGTIHGDLKPSNIMINCEGEPHIIDFELPHPPAKGQVVGTPAYMAPELVRAEERDTRSDVYSLGGVLFELLTGQLPFDGSLAEIFARILNDKPPSPRTLNPDVPQIIEDICLKCLEKMPSKRYGTARELADDLNRAIGDQA